MDRRIAVPALFAIAASGVAYALVRLRRDRAGAARGSASSAAHEAEYHCACGQRFHVAGVGRHRIYWLPGASAGDPVLSDDCPQCERPLPREDQPAPA
jgi:hypothetical protein